MRNFEASTISVNDVLHTLRECERDHKYERVFDHMLAFASELTGISVDTLSMAMYPKQSIDFLRVAYRDYDNTGVPLQLFFGYEPPEEVRKAFMSALGYKSDECVDVELCLDVYEPGACPIEVVLTFADGDQQWVDMPSSDALLLPLMQIVESCSGERAAEALQLVREIVPEIPRTECDDALYRINREKLIGYLEDEMILEFDSEEACMKYFNTYDSQDFKSVDEMKAYQSEYGFGLFGKWYHVSFEEALDVWEPAPLEQERNQAWAHAVEGVLLPGEVKVLTDELRREVMERHWWARHEMNGIAGYEGFEPIAEQLERKFYISELQVCAADHGFYLDVKAFERVVPTDLDLFMKQLDEAGSLQGYLKEHGLWRHPKSLEAQMLSAEKERHEAGIYHDAREVERE